jgi:putative zinc finger/helix-turn-helix YgiT family protein
MADETKNTQAGAAVSCPRCGARQVTKREDYPYMPGGLEGFVLRGVRVTRCPDCNAVKVRIPSMESLHREIAFQLAKKDTRLLPEEIRFLRKYLGWSGIDFAGHMGVRPETASRWENGKERMENPAERLLRLMAVHGEPVREYPLETLAQIDSRRARPAKIKMRVDADEWRAVGSGR